MTRNGLVLVVIGDKAPRDLKCRGHPIEGQSKLIHGLTKGGIIEIDGGELRQPYRGEIHVAIAFNGIAVLAHL